MARNLTRFLFFVDLQENRLTRTSALYEPLGPFVEAFDLPDRGVGSGRAPSFAVNTLFGTPGGTTLQDTQH